MKNDNDTLLDMKGRKIEFGHIVAVRYVWNSYVGVARMKGLCAEGNLEHAFFSPHSYDNKATYQILGHMDKDHINYNEDVYNCKGKLPRGVREKFLEKQLKEKQSRSGRWENIL